MRRNILHVGAQNLKYEIREIVGAAHEIEALGQEITWENIGDPVQKGEVPPKWIREIVADLVDQADSWAYCDSQGVAEVREFLANEVNRRDGVRVSADDIIFFNGLGDAVAKVYGFLLDLTDIRNKVKHNDSIAGILLLSPDNPTGAVLPQGTARGDRFGRARARRLHHRRRDLRAHRVQRAGPRRSRATSTA